jgi:hypothetical protein
MAKSCNSVEHRIVTRQTQSTMPSTLEHYSFFGEFDENDFSDALQYCHRRWVDPDFAQRKLAERYITVAIPFSIRGTSTHIRSLTAALLHPNFSSAPAHSNRLIIHKPFSGDLPLKGHSLPSMKDIEALLGSMPHLKALDIGSGHCDRSDDRDAHDRDADKEEIQVFTKSREELGPRLLKALVRMHPEGLTSLVLHDMTISSNLLLDVLCTFYDSLRHVDLTAIQLEGTPKKPATWETIFKILLDMKLEKLRLADLVVPGTSERMVMSPLSLEYEELGHMCRTEEDPDADMDGVQGGGATYTRWGASFWQGYVKKGLEKLLGLGDFPLYQEEWITGDDYGMKLVTLQLL